MVVIGSQTTWLEGAKYCLHALRRVSCCSIGTEKYFPHLKGGGFSICLECGGSFSTCIWVVAPANVIHTVNYTMWMRGARQLPFQEGQLLLCMKI